VTDSANGKTVLEQHEREDAVILLPPRPPPGLESMIREATAVCPTKSIVVTAQA